MAVKTFKRKKGENWFQLSARLFGSQQYAADLEKMFGSSGIGTQLRVNTRRLTGRFGAVAAEDFGLNPLGLGEDETQFNTGGTAGEAGTSEQYSTPVPEHMFQYGTPLPQYSTPVSPDQYNAPQGQYSTQMPPPATMQPPVGGPILDGRPTSEAQKAQQQYSTPTPQQFATPVQRQTPQQVSTRPLGTAFRNFLGLTQPLGQPQQFATPVQRQTPHPGIQNFGQSVETDFQQAAGGIPNIGEFISGAQNRITEAVMGLPSSHPEELTIGQAMDVAKGVKEKIDSGELPNIISGVVAQMILGNDYADILGLIDYVFNSATGYWELTGGTSAGSGTGSTGIGGGYYSGRGAGYYSGRGAGVGVGGGDGGVGAGGQRGSSYVPSGSNLFYWRVNFG